MSLVWLKNLRMLEFLSMLSGPKQVLKIEIILFNFNHQFFIKCRGPARVNSDKRHGPKSSDSVLNEIATRDNLPRPNCDSDGKANNKRQAFINTDTRRFKIQTGPPWQGLNIVSI